MDMNEFKRLLSDLCDSYFDAGRKMYREEINRAEKIKVFNSAEAKKVDLILKMESVLNG